MRELLLVLAAATVGCAAQAGAPPSCTPGERTCASDQLSTCAADGSGATLSPCPLGCEAGACRACTPGTTRCDGAARLECAAGGATWTQTSCPYGCDDATGGCLVAACAPGAVSCVGSTLRTCSADGAVLATAACPYGCDAAGAACRATPPACAPGATSCSGAKLVTCRTDGQGLDEQLCPYGCDAAAAVPACQPPACAAGERRCSPTDPQLVEACAADRSTWVGATVCPGTCAAGACEAAPTCTPGEEACRRSVAVHRDEIDRCAADGHWETAVAVCTAGSCVATAGPPAAYQCGACWLGERTCQGEDVFACPDPLAGAARLLTCGAPSVCVAGACAAPLALDDGAGPPAPYPTLAQAFVDCWDTYQGSTVDQMCSTVDGQNQSGDVTFGQLKDWVCGAAAAADFQHGQPDLDVARDLVGCGLWNNSEIFWFWDPLPPGTLDEACVWYHPSGTVLLDDEDTLDRCDRFRAGP